MLGTSLQRHMGLSIQLAGIMAEIYCSNAVKIHIWISKGKDTARGDGGNPYACFPCSHQRVRAERASPPVVKCGNTCTVSVQGSLFETLNSMVLLEAGHVALSA